MGRNDKRGGKQKRKQEGNIVREDI